MRDQLERHVAGISIVHLSNVVVYGLSKNAKNAARTRFVNPKALTTCTANSINANEEEKLCTVVKKNYIMLLPLSTFKQFI